MWLNLQRIVDKRGRTGKNMRGDNFQGVTPSEMNKIYSDDQKRSSVFQEKINRGDTAELTADRW